MVDIDGFRPNVGIVLTGDDDKLLWAKRIGQDAWQFPQGGIQRGESAEAACFRELYEELGLREEDVEVVARTKGWLRYRLPLRYIRRGKHPLCIGQKQKWFLLRLKTSTDAIVFDATGSPEFDRWCWVDWDLPPKEVVFFKRSVYRRALRQLAEELGSETALEAITRN
ncbi:MAG: RNA pyrophosphohydrolase [Oceanococcaceae bacterium]